MAEEQFGLRRDFLKELAPWTKLFSAFKIALDPKKLVLAALGLMVMSLGWYLISVLFFAMNSTRPEWSTYVKEGDDFAAKEVAFKQFKRDRQRWYLLYELAGSPHVEKSDGKDAVADGTNPEYVARPTKEDLADQVNSLLEYEARKKIGGERDGNYKPYGRFRVMPWFEDRGPNPYLLVVSSDSVPLAQKGPVPSGRDGIVNWFLTDQLPVLLEPLIKFFMPIRYLTDPAAGFMNHVYLLLIMLWSVATWAFFGGAITRIAVVQVARPNERISLNDAVKFVAARYRSYLLSPLLPLLFLFVLAFILVVFGALEAWTLAFGDIVFTLMWPLVLLVGLIMAVVLVGLVGWPLMYSTISAEGSDAFDAISRSYSYVYQAPWHFLWYSFVALVYGAALVFFVGFMGSLLVNMSKWAVTLPPTLESREPSYLFRYAPTSFQWRELLLRKSPNVETRIEVSTRGVERPVSVVKSDKEYPINWHNNIGAFFVSVWLYLLFLMIVGFGYSYFWTASTIIYLLMRRKVDDTEMDEIHWEEEPELPFPVPQPAPATESAKAAQSTLQMVEPPQIRGSGGAETPGATPANPDMGQRPPRPDGPAGAH